MNNNRVGRVVVVLLAASGALGVAYFYCGLCGFIAGAIAGEGPAIAEQHAKLNEVVLGCVGGVWASWLTARWVWRRTKRPPDPP